MTRIILVGPLKTNYIINGTKQYLKWISKYEKVQLIQLPLSGDLNKIPEKDYKDKDFEKIQKYLPDSYNIVLDENGDSLTSVEFANLYDNIKSTCGRKYINFIIGGPLGHSQKIFEYSNKTLSLSKLTFTHEFATLILLEQLFRINKILNNERYHY
ncbi:MAG TPA: 23S rRNA (pseudouridine(1915)-N(3))-methyltransferase RlmH [Defluviitoga tunisiensis]|jgi:23S rRNA (pseudouridine1915-N3)-methyltransferase|nr:23S rRNA (pseudouridine(1915)-N(3))-methyltransferase RlmH [Defluviitoga tunisiensis]HHV02042.1 23S rRNA (pseudouridine(1915)-N(3))-methyltransferase RlmH [Defluviitoga tunisiensis]HOB55397.1 23S rRNA (pseudouridine(1915)-N(3))-methyltransferase RlmH [Defluviitoga tunisiensis]HOK16023.1 23S rRNA (pseudouridine(1915)-N(3))-methyltransferase RlmH [Defluviitoga tunisiensis]HOL86224.1 23S rRNA (pseudouridine(1915)-N(3))-methyltransferase RlmH [Defluviitoga tunisiensis]